MSTDETRRLLERSIEDLRDGRLTESRLTQALEALNGARPKRQDLLYLQTGRSSVDSDVLGMLLVQGGELDEGPRDPDEWPYATVLEAMKDGWRIIQFPELALLLDESRTYGLGCQFVLERWH